MTIKRASESEKPTERIPFGILELDTLTEGGIPTRKISELFGSWSVGKSTLANYLIAQAQKEGREVLFADTEFSWDSTYSQSLGVDTNKVFLLQNRIAEEVMDGIEAWIAGIGDEEKHENALVIMDSIGQLLPRAEAEKGSEGRVVGGQAKLVASFCRRIKGLLHENNVALVLLNHSYDPIAFGGGAMTQRAPQEKPSGGAKLEYAKDLSIHLKKTYIKQGEKVLTMTRSDGTKGGNFIKATIYKSKIASNQAKEAVFALSFGEGVKQDWNLLEMALERGVITRQGNSFYFKDTKLAVGLDKTREAIKEENLKQEIKTALSTNPTE